MTATDAEMADLAERIKAKTHWTLAELRAEAEARFGPDVRDFAYQCPACGDVATVQQFLDACESVEVAQRAAGRECIGRHLGALAGGPTEDGGRSIAERGCDWASWGLFRGPWFVTTPDGHELTAFPLAPAGWADATAPESDGGRS